MAGQRQLLGELANLLDADLARVIDGTDALEVRMLKRGDSSATHASAARSVLSSTKAPVAQPMLRATPPPAPGSLVNQQTVRHSVRRESRAQCCHFIFLSQGMVSSLPDFRRFRRSAPFYQTFQYGGHLIFDRGQVTGGVDYADSFGLLARQSEIARAHALEELLYLRLESVGRHA